MKNQLNVEYRLIQLTKRLLDEDELEQLSNAGAYGIGSEKRLIIRHYSLRTQKNYVPT